MKNPSDSNQNINLPINREEIDSKIKDIAPNLKRGTRQNISKYLEESLKKNVKITANQVHQVSIQTRSQADFLPPALLREYEALVPGAAESLLKAALEQGTHRRGLEKIVIEGNSKRAWAGSWFSFILGSFAIIGGILIMLLTEKEIWGLASVITAIAGLAGVFIFGRIMNKKENEGKKSNINISFRGH
ncbi:MAG: DUF2335 domain-containing protein [Spirochaetia bacterium]|nr:DUF2335 domain-containing protein [Spirochaetia bacterium]